MTCRCITPRLVKVLSNGIEYHVDQYGENRMMRRWRYSAATVLIVGAAMAVIGFVRRIMNL